LHNASASKIGKKSNPQTMVATEGDDEIITCQEKSHANDHRQEHKAGGGGTDVNSVPQEGRHATYRKKQSPMAITGYGFQH
jgi:glutamine synthetase type III